jgi:hypothetical protein
MSTTAAGFRVQIAYDLHTLLTCETVLIAALSGRENNLTFAEQRSLDHYAGTCAGFTQRIGACQNTGIALYFDSLKRTRSRSKNGCQDAL